MTNPEAGGIPQDRSVTTRRLIGKDNKPYRIDYYSFAGTPMDESRNNFANPVLHNLKPDLESMVRSIFPNYDESGVQSTVSKFDKFASFALAFNDEGKPVAFNIYKLGEVETKVRPLKTIYVEHAGTLPQNRNAGITQAIRTEFYRMENPDVICGSSANGVIYIANKKIAESQNMEFYPTGPETPAHIVELANRIHDDLGLRNAKLDEQLVRSYEGPTSRGEITHPLNETLPLELNQHIFYMIVKHEVSQELQAAA